MRGLLVVGLGAVIGLLYAIQWYAFATILAIAGSLILAGFSGPSEEERDKDDWRRS